jgi:uncharacterized integral membrane protein
MIGTLLGMLAVYVVGALILMLVGASIQYDKKGKVK